MSLCLLPTIMNCELNKNLAVFASGSGSNFEAIAQACVDGRIPAKIVLLVCDNANAYAIERAKKFDIPTLVLHPRDCGGKPAYEQRIVDRLNELNVDLVCLAGYMRIVGETLYNAYQGRILNIHPALLPSFKGVHFIDLTIDGGVIVMQRAFEYYGNDRDEVEARIHAIEHELYPEAIKKCIIHNS